MTDILTNDEISLLRSLEKKSRTITGTLTNKRYDRLEFANVIKRLWEIGRVSCASSIGTLFPELGPASCHLIGEWWIEV